MGFLDDESESAKISVVEGVNHTDFFVRGHHQKSVWVGCSRPKKNKKTNQNTIKLVRILINADFLHFLGLGSKANFLRIYGSSVQTMIVAKLLEHWHAFPQCVCVCNALFDMSSLHGFAWEQAPGLSKHDPNMMYHGAVFCVGCF